MTDQDKLWRLARAIDPHLGVPCWLLADLIGASRSTISSVMIGDNEELPATASVNLNRILQEEKISCNGI